VHQPVINAHLVYLSDRCQSTTVWPSMLVLNVGLACWRRSEISSSWARVRRVARILHRGRGHRSCLGALFYKKSWRLCSRRPQNL